eukprot:710543-Alexandrium_andersonii.AAC.1
MDDENVTRGVGMLRRVVLELLDFPEFLRAVKAKQKFLLSRRRPDKTTAPDRGEVTKEINGLVDNIYKKAATVGLAVELAEQALRRKFPDR